MQMGNKTYDVIKWFATIVLPALGTLYFALASIWEFPYAEQVVGTITAIVTFLGVVLKISSHNYSGDGVLAVQEGADPVVALDGSLLDLVSGKTVTLTVHKEAKDDEA